MDKNQQNHNLSLLDPANQLFTLARSGRRLPHMLAAIPLSFIIILAAGLSGGVMALFVTLALSIIGGEIGADELITLFGALSAGQASPDVRVQLNGLILPNSLLDQVIFLIFSFGPIFLILWGWLALIEKRPLTSIGMERSGAGFKYVRGLGVGLLMFVASIGISAAFGFLAFESGPPQSQGLAALGSVLFVFLGWTIQGPAEEAITRGWLLPVIGARYNPSLGVFISSAVFAAFHALNFVGLSLGPIFVTLALFNLFLFGVFAALYALHEGSMWGVFSIHAVWNWAQGNLFGFEVSGGDAPGGTLLNLMETGPDVVTGGSFGPEGGLGVTIVLIIGCGLVWWANKRRQEGRNEFI